MLAVLVIISVMALSLAGCGGTQDTASEILATAENMMSALQDGDFDKFEGYVTEEVLVSDDMSVIGALKTFRNDMLTSLGVTEKDMTDETLTAIDKVSDAIRTEFVKSYELGEVEEKDGAGYVPCTITFGFDPEKLDSDDYSKELESLVVDYTSQNIDELAKIYNEKGQDELSKAIIDGVLPAICDKVIEIINNSEESTKSVTLTVENRDGKWMVTDADFED